jgi:hypothetical protein
VFNHLTLGLLLTSSLLLVAKPASPKSGRSPKGQTVDVPTAGSFGELLDIKTRKSKAIGAMTENRTDYQMTPMSDGRVLVTGGSLRTASSEWFDPGTRKFTPGPGMVQIRQGHRALMLRNGSVLVLGGTETAMPPEILEAGAGKFKVLPGEAKFSISADAVEMADGRVLMVDGASGKGYAWDPKKGVRFAGNLNHPRIFFRLTSLADGKALLTGGWSVGQTSSPKALPVECFNPKWSNWSTWKAEPRVRARHCAERLSDGKVYLWGGYGKDAASTAETMEILDPAKETATVVKTLSLGRFPGWTLLPQGQGVLLGEGGRNPMKLDVQDLGKDARDTSMGCLANGYFAPQIVPLKDGNLLIAGTPTWGASLERWDPKLRQCLPLGALRAGTERLAQLKDGRVLALGPVVDVLDPSTGNLTPLGWKEDLVALLKNIPPAPSVAASDKSADPMIPRKNYLSLALGKGQSMIVGGTNPNDAKPVRTIETWDAKRHRLQSVGELKTARTFPSSAAEAQGGLVLRDGSALIYSCGEE